MSKRLGFRGKIRDVHGLHDGYMLSLRPGYTALVGPNGAGKTTLLSQLAEIAKSRKYLCFRYSNLSDGGQSAMQLHLARGRLDKLAAAAYGSEGQNVVANFADVAARIGGHVARAIETDTPLFVLLDGLDSGTSIDAQRQLMEFLRMVERDAGVHPGGADHEVYVLNAVNGYEMARNAVCVDVRTGEHMIFDGYEHYARFICDYFKKGRDLTMDLLVIETYEREVKSLKTVHAPEDAFRRCNELLEAHCKRIEYLDEYREYLRAVAGNPAAGGSDIQLASPDAPDGAWCNYYGEWDAQIVDLAKYGAAADTQPEKETARTDNHAPVVVDAVDERNSFVLHIKLKPLVPDLDPVAAIKAAVDEFLSTARGGTALAETRGQFNYGDFVNFVPDEICAGHGFVVTETSVSNIVVKHDDSFIRDSLDFL